MKEPLGVYRAGSAAIDFDCDGALENTAYAHGLYAAVDGNAMALTALKDQNDWAALDLFFTASYQGFNHGVAHSPAEDDAQPLAPFTPVPASHLRWLRERR